TTRPAAIVWVYGTMCGPAVKRAIATVDGVTDALPTDSTLDSRNSFQDARKTRIAVVNSAGPASGKITSRNACPGVAPSTRAACSSSERMSDKKLDRLQTASGSENEICGRISPW